MEIQVVSYHLQHELQLGRGDYFLSAPTYFNVPELDFSGASQVQGSQPYYQTRTS